MAVEKAWKVYGADGHRQRESFNASQTFDFSEGTNVRKIEIENSDKTGTNDFSVVRITRNSATECSVEMAGQLSDGIFENSKIGRIFEINPDGTEREIRTLEEI